MIEFYRPGTDDDRFVIPEIVTQDMYRMAELAQRLSGRNGTILDGGAHIGAASVMFAIHFPESRIVAYEPEPESFALLKKNVMPYPAIEPRPCALALPGERSVKLTYQDGTGRCSGTPWISVGRSFDAAAVALESEIRGNAPILILKLDLEGYESRLLNSLSGVVLRQVEALIVETHPWTGETLQTDRMNDAGFQLWFHPCGDPRHAVYLREN